MEQLQFLYGVDSDGDGWIDQYLKAKDIAANQWRSVHAVRFWVLVREDCPETGYTDGNTYKMGGFSYTPNDGYRRALFTSTVALRSLR